MKAGRYVIVIREMRLRVASGDRHCSGFRRLLADDAPLINAPYAATEGGDVENIWTRRVKEYAGAAPGGEGLNGRRRRCW